MAGKNQWVVRRDGYWAVRGERNCRDTSHHNTQREAIAAARAIAQNQPSGLLVQNLHGRIRERISY